jgi:hypothetical protein
MADAPKGYPRPFLVQYFHDKRREQQRATKPRKRRKVVDRAGAGAAAAVLIAATVNGARAEARPHQCYAIVRVLGSPPRVVPCPPSRY